MSDSTMRAMRLDAAHRPLRLTSVAIPTPGAGQVLIQVHACAVCRTDLHVVDADLTEPKLPLVPGHEIIGDVVAVGEGEHKWKIGDRVGGPWHGGKPTASQIRVSFNNCIMIKAMTIHASHANAAYSKCERTRQLTASHVMGDMESMCFSAPKP